MNQWKFKVTPGEQVLADDIWVSWRDSELSGVSRAADIDWESAGLIWRLADCPTADKLVAPKGEPTLAEVMGSQVGGSHYKDHAIQPWDIIIEYGLNFFEGTALRYLLRDKDNRIEDLQKLQHTIDREILILREAEAENEG